ncbi:MAG: hypothetical protein QG670_1231 [Thermoproteota archaeon]|nr:hypothetical protein [Thermoproteota archaeon]
MREDAANEIMMILSMGRKRNNFLNRFDFLVNLSWKSSSRSEEEETIARSQGNGIWKPNIKAMRRLRIKPNTRFSLSIFFDKVTPIIMPRIIDDE